MHITTSEIRVILEQMILKGEIVHCGDKIYPVEYFAQEDETARRIASILAEPVDISSALIKVKNTLGITLSQKQSEAVYMAFRSNLSIITRGPGTGKATVLRVVIEVFKTISPNDKMLLAAPTGRASRRMAESTGCNDARTLHSVLGLQGENNFVTVKNEPLDADLIIVDESSMIDM